MERVRRSDQLGFAVRDAREAIRLTQQQVADAAGVSRRTINALEAGEARNIGLEKVLSILDVLGVGLWLDDASASSAHEASVGFDRDISYEEALEMMLGSTL